MAPMRCARCSCAGWRRTRCWCWSTASAITPPRWSTSTAARAAALRRPTSTPFRSPRWNASRCCAMAPPRSTARTPSPASSMSCSRAAASGGGIAGALRPVQRRRWRAIPALRRRRLPPRRQGRRAPGRAGRAPGPDQPCQAVQRRGRATLWRPGDRPRRGFVQRPIQSGGLPHVLFLRNGQPPRSPVQRLLPLEHRQSQPPADLSGRLFAANLQRQQGCFLGRWFQDQHRRRAQYRH